MRAYRGASCANANMDCLVLNIDRAKAEDGKGWLLTVRQCTIVACFLGKCCECAIVFLELVRSLLRVMVELGVFVSKSHASLM